VSNERFYEEYPHHNLVPVIQDKIDSDIREKKQKKILFLWLGPALAMALVVLFVFILPDNQLTDSTRIKGRSSSPANTGPKIFLFRKLGDRIEELKEGSKTHPGELLQIAYLVRKQKYGIIFSIDGDGMLTRHFPEEGQLDTLLVRDQRHFLTQAYELDNAPEFERFYFLSSKEKIDMKTIFAKINNKEMVSKENRVIRGLDPKIALTSFLIVKGDKK
jgi:hypothetical protein